MNTPEVAPQGPQPPFTNPQPPPITLALPPQVLDAVQKTSIAPTVAGYAGLAMVVLGGIAYALTQSEAPKLHEIGTFLALVAYGFGHILPANGTSTTK